MEMMMAVPNLDKKFMNYWDQLSNDEKKSLFKIARHYVYLKTENELSADEDRESLVEEERKKFLAGEGTSFTWEEVKEMAMNKKKRKLA